MHLAVRMARKTHARAAAQLPRAKAAISRQRPASGGESDTSASLTILGELSFFGDVCASEGGTNASDTASPNRNTPREPDETWDPIAAAAPSVGIGCVEHGLLAMREDGTVHWTEAGAGQWPQPFKFIQVPEMDSECVEKGSFLIYAEGLDMLVASEEDGGLRGVDRPRLHTLARSMQWQILLRRAGFGLWNAGAKRFLHFQEGGTIGVSVQIPKPVYPDWLDRQHELYTRAVGPVSLSCCMESPGKNAVLHHAPSGLPVDTDISGCVRGGGWTTQVTGRVARRDQTALRAAVRPIASDRSAIFLAIDDEYRARVTRGDGIEFCSGQSAKFEFFPHRFASDEIAMYNVEADCYLAADVAAGKLKTLARNGDREWYDPPEDVESIRFCFMPRADHLLKMVLTPADEPANE